MKKRFILILSFLVVLTLFTGCTSQKEEPEDVAGEEEKVVDEKEGGEIILSTTTSTEDSGLLDYLLPKFEEETGIDIKVVAVGTGKALQMGEDGEADILLVHAKESEEEFVEAGHGLGRDDVMYNDFILVGPEDDPLELKTNSPDNILEGLKTISEGDIGFVSRGDDSGTHKKELSIWAEAGIDPEDNDWYISAGSGMADVLKIANDKNVYTITDRATYLSMKDTLDLEIIIEGDENLFNQYGVILVNPEKSDKINVEEAEKLKEWLLSDEVQKLIGEYGEEEFGMPLFVPNAK